jgi:MFS family permease
VALPDIQRIRGRAGLQWVVAAYSLGMAIFIMSAATLADLHGRRRWYIAGIAVSRWRPSRADSPTLEILNLARAVQGVAAATANVTSLALVSAAFRSPSRRRARSASGRRSRARAPLWSQRSAALVEHGLAQHLSH